MQEQYQKKFTGDATVFGNTVVLYGGLSAEREISLQSGQAVLQGLQHKGVKVTGIDVAENAVEQIVQQRPERVFIALHGPGGEDGKIQAVLDWLKIPYTGSKHSASALAMDKLRTKQVWNSVELPTPRHLCVTENSDWQKVIHTLGGEVFIKPAHEGSSLGMSSAASAVELKQAYEKARQYDSSVLVEQRIKGPEYTVAILNGVALPPIMLRTDHTFYDYDAKYRSDTTEYICPCGLEEQKERALKQLALDAFDAIGCSGWGRVDVMADAAGNFYLLEVNTVPGMTSHSLVPMAAKQAGLGFDDLVVEILTQANY